jgi:molybdopterin-containing oxidoreductase family iron-sulfur binding subunit
MNSEPSSGSSSSSSSGYDLVRGYWKEQNLWKASPSDDSSEEAWERWWEEVLRRGVIVGTEYPVQEVIFRPDAVESVLSRKSPSHSPAVDGVRINADSSSTKELDSTSNGSNNQPTLSLEFVADPHIWDGRYANNAWLQELPKPFSKIVWGNALWISPRLADQRNLANGDVVRVTDRATSTAIELPVWIMPGQAPQTLTVHLGGGMNCGSVSAGRGTSVAALRRRDSMYLCSDVSVEPTGTNHRLATTQDHHQMEGRHPVLAGTLSEVHEHPESPHFMHVGEHHPDASMIGEWEYNSYKWGMAIDLTSCTGCSACVIACQAENNIPVVGPVQVEMGREMHWLRIDTYFHGEPDEPTFYHQPLACVHCEKAPCEVVCPVAATTHSDEGINEMTYNRCVGTRYCSNNCPYKVRRFNFLEYTNTDAPVLELLRNPNVTVRSRGVMEKCTYCVQRINHARVSAEIAGRRIGPDDIATACQAACPTQAITFGDLNRREFEVTAWRNSPLAYQLLAELNTQPRTSYLASVLNPNRRIQHHE